MTNSDFNTQLEKQQMISNHLQEVSNKLIEETENIFNLNDFYIAGGCIYSLWNNNEPKDYDIFPKTSRAKNAILNYFKKNKRANIITKNAITYGDGKYQFIIKYIGRPEIEVAKFDFKHNMFWFDNTGLHNMVSWDYLDGNKLEFNSIRSRDILNIITRIPKFTNRGMEISQAEILSIIESGTRPTRILKERAYIKSRMKSNRGEGY